jgi:uncharacterized surface protein with fasciclin (FAS1) repeats
MNAKKGKSSMTKLTALLGVTAAGVLISLPAIAQSKLNPRPTIFDEAPYNRARSNQPAIQPTTPSNVGVPAPTAPSTGEAPTSTPPEALPSTGGVPTSTPEAGTMPSSSPTATTGNIVDVAASNGSFKTLTAALKAAGLTEALSAQGPFTVFAPTDAAFAALPKGTVEKLLKPENKEKLVKLLAYHVIPGAVTSSQLKSGEVPTAEGSSINVKVDNTNNAVTINDAKVIGSDVKASNGIIHAVDKVIMPPQ